MEKRSLQEKEYLFQQYTVKIQQNYGENTCTTQKCYAFHMQQVIMNLQK